MAEHGLLLAHRDGWGQCELPAAQVVLLHPTASSIEAQVFDSVEKFLDEQWEVARGVTQRNPLCTQHLWGDLVFCHRSPLSPHQCHRTSAMCCAAEQLSTLSQIEVDLNRHLWFAGDGALWRFSAMPSFVLQANPSLLWMTPGSTRKSTLFVQPVEGFQGAAELTVGVLPGEFAATGLPATVNAGEVSGSTSPPRPTLRWAIIG
jgi:hypothetical protein